MALIVNPPVNAIPVYPWMKVQDFYVGVLETVRASQAAIDPAYDFDIIKNQLYPDIQGSEKNQVVNIMIGNRTDELASRHDKDVNIEFLFEIYATSHDEGDDEADRILVERFQYLSAMVEFAITALYNNIDKAQIPIGEMDPRGMSVSYVDPENLRKTNNLFMMGTVTLNVVFGSIYPDWENLPALQTVSAALGGLVQDYPANV